MYSGGFRAIGQLLAMAQGQDAIAKYLTLYNVKLQLQPQILQALGVAQPPGDKEDCANRSECSCCEAESSPPVIRYDRRIIESLYAHGVTETCTADVRPAAVQVSEEQLCLLQNRQSGMSV
eukprot:574410-Amphidinium_carterae.1